MKVELTTIELKALELKDINNFNDKKIARQNFSALLYPINRSNVFIFLPGIFQ